MHDIFHHLEEQKNLFCFSQACFGLRAVFGIFLAFRRPSAFFRPKKSLKQPSGQNNLAAAKKVFCSSSWLICRCISPKNIPFVRGECNCFCVQWGHLMEQQTNRASSSVMRESEEKAALLSHTRKTPLSAQSPKSGKRRILLQILLAAFGLWTYM